MRSNLLIRGGTIISGGSNPPFKADVAIGGDHIVEVRPHLEAGPGWTVIDAAGKFVVPGFIDLHAHLISGGFDTISNAGMTFDLDVARRVLQQMLYWGVTSVYSPVQPLDFGLRLRKETQATTATRLFISGPGFTAPGGWAGANLAEARYEPQNAAEAERDLDELADAHIDIVKIFFDDMSCAFRRPLSKLSTPVMQTIVRGAHERGLQVMVHAYALENHKDTMRAGADIMAHSVITAPVDEEYITLAREHNVMYQGTLSIYHDAFDETSIRKLIENEAITRSVPAVTLRTLSYPGPLDEFESMIRQTFIRQQLPVIAANMRKVWEEGIELGVGPDTGVMGAFPGFAVHREMELMAQAGVPTAAVLHAATAAAADRLHRADLGRIEVGGIADLVVLTSNPLDDILHTRSVEQVIRGGVVVDRDELRKQILAADRPQFAEMRAQCC